MEITQTNEQRTLNEDEVRRVASWILKTEEAAKTILQMDGVTGQLEITRALKRIANGQ
jgi:hypothetical protein